jgi:hypothetical protein
MYLSITIDGATKDEITKGLAAAKAVFDQAGVTPLDAAEGRFAVEGWDIGGFVGEISDRDLDMHSVWLEAETAALEACCAGWDEARRPKSPRMEILEHADPELIVHL